MFKNALIFLVIAIIAGCFRYQSTQPTLKLIEKIIFYFSVTAFLVLLFTAVISAHHTVEGSG